MVKLGRVVMLRRYVANAEIIPKGYGVAWNDPARLVAVCYPVPLNKLFGLVRRLCWNLVRPPKGPECDALRAKAEGLERRLQFYQDRDRRDAEFRDRIGRALVHQRLDS